MRNKGRATAIDQWAERWALCNNKEKYVMIELQKGMKDKDIWERTKIQQSYMELTEKHFRCLVTLKTAALWVHEKDPWEKCLRIPYKNMEEGNLPRDPDDEPIMPMTEEEWDEIWEGWKQE
jgi:hypothetical protein